MAEQQRDDTVRVPMSREVARILARADAELVEASQAGTAGERFVHAHLGALRAASAIVAMRGRPARRSGTRTVWDMLAAVEPALGTWSVYFARGASTRSAIDAGRFDAVDSARADELLACAEDFRDEVAMVIDPDARFVRYPLRLIAS
ncbi:SAV_6107 family HEPN domain-containing protein [Cellulomonas sp. PhB143]|uniref:SAV_6107 family HEPN domain-containing protein n=1 Tax=Cellulomonas sp. PhB143 TaxID=2485186 RepID=UPI000F467258|nr:SAV_6107 family HEPN domain-containing protein [Cellulomonas sp. PhB143]ROS77198.1 hypothetical protein EDF32_1195 [Cellulomonas sp. PhB143]